MLRFDHVNVIVSIVYELIGSLDSEFLDISRAGSSGPGRSFHNRAESPTRAEK
jgi:hypothetical protein